MNQFNENYYENGINTGVSLYTNYRWIPELSIPLAFHIIELLQIKKEHTILDYGCAKGYLVKALRLLNRQSYGVDISEYAINNADKYIENYVKHIHNVEDIKENYDFVISKDVFEHIPKNTLTHIVSYLRKITKTMFVVVPLGDGTKYFIDSYELDKTHIIRENKDWWINLFQNSGFTNIQYFNKLQGVKENYSAYQNGNGFFILN